MRPGLALVPEGRRIFGTLTVAENLRLGGDRAKGSRSRQGRRSTRVSSGSRSCERPTDTPAGRLSGGEQQQLAIARALVARPRLLLLDEPSLGLAPLMVDHVFDELAELRDEGATILLVEQNAKRTVELADRTYVLRTGTVDCTGTREELLAEADFEAAYFGI